LLPERVFLLQGEGPEAGLDRSRGCGRHRCLGDDCSGDIADASDHERFGSDGRLYDGPSGVGMGKGHLERPSRCSGPTPHLPLDPEGPESRVVVAGLRAAPIAGLLAHRSRTIRFIRGPTDSRPRGVPPTDDVPLTTGFDSKSGANPSGRAFTVGAWSFPIDGARLSRARYARSPCSARVVRPAHCQPVPKRAPRHPLGRARNLNCRRLDTWILPNVATSA
jgi:hypothetical protein